MRGRDVINSGSIIDTLGKIASTAKSSFSFVSSFVITQYGSVSVPVPHVVVIVITGAATFISFLPPVPAYA